MRAPKRPNPNTPVSLRRGRFVGYLWVSLPVTRKWQETGRRPRGKTYEAGRRVFKEQRAIAKAARKAAFRAAKRAA